MDKERPGLEAAFSLRDAEDARRLYRDWADTYDTEFAAATGYRSPRVVARALADAGGTGPVLDIGAGTGLVGEELSALGIGPVDGTDLSPEMLAVAEEKGVYARTFVADITERLPVEDGAYAGAVSAGTFTLGHVGPAALDEVVRVLRPGGLLAIAVNRAHWEQADFAAAFDALADRLQPPEIREHGIFEGEGGAHAGDTFFLVTARRGF